MEKVTVEIEDFVKMPVNNGKKYGQNRWFDETGRK